MDMKKKQHELETSMLFQKWKQHHHDAYLTHFFILNNHEVQIGYYEPTKDTMWTFSSSGTFTEDKEIFKEQKTVPALEMKQVSVSLEKAKEIADAYYKEKYSGDTISKEIIVLQNLDNKAVYNLTIITMTFKMMNIRIDALTGEIISQKMQSIMDLVQTFETTKKSSEVKII